MKRVFLLCIVLSSATSAAASAQAELAKAKNCLACHATANKLVGPAFKDIAGKYANQKDAEDKLSQKVMKGGAGSWGPVPMPANPQVNEDEARNLVKWILTTR